MLLEEEKGQRRKSWQLGVGALEEQQQQLLDAQRSAAQALSETDTCIFIHRYHGTAIVLSSPAGKSAGKRVDEEKKR